MVSVCTVPARGGRSCEHFGGYKAINRIPLYVVFIERSLYKGNCSESIMHNTLP